MEGIYSRFNNALREAKVVGSFQRPIMIAFRTQASGEYEDDGTQTDTCKHKTRVVSMVDLLQIVAELHFSVPIQSQLALMSEYAGGKSERDISRIISGCRGRNRQWLSLDYSNYDQTISSWLIEDAFNLLKSCFVMTSEEEEIWNLVVHDFIHKDFILSQGVLHSDRGVPSGSMFTQIIDTVVNWIVMQTYANSIREKIEMIAMGDDNLIFTRVNRIDVSAMSSYIRKNFGLDVHDDDKTAQGTTRYGDWPKFLSRYWRNDGEYRHPNQLLSHLLFSERFRQYSQSVTPQLVVYSYILTYGPGMKELINVEKFLDDFPFRPKDIDVLVHKGYLPGVMAYQKDYGLVA